MQIHFCECGCGQPISDWSYGIARLKKMDYKSDEDIYIVSNTCLNKDNFYIFFTDREYEYILAKRRINL